MARLDRYRCNSCGGVFEGSEAAKQHILDEHSDEVEDALQDHAVEAEGQVFEDLMEEL